MPNAITRDQYDAVLLDLDGVITDTASMHATCWKQMFDAYCSSGRRREANHFVLSRSPRTTGSMWMGSPASTACATFSPHAVSN
jgi:beta-phosphoglucomutase-like phosphatase (HAD superfamily)